MTNLNKIFRDFSFNIAFIQLHQRQINVFVKNEIIKLKRNDSFSMNNFCFNSPIDGEEIQFAVKESSNVEQIKLIQIQKNKEFQWLLAESYEYYEKFLHNIYAYLIYQKKIEIPNEYSHIQ